MDGLIPETAPSTQSVEVRVHLQDAYDHMHLVYWLKNVDDKSWHQREAINNIRRAADLLGYDLVPRKQEAA